MSSRQLIHLDKLLDRQEKAWRESADHQRQRPQFITRDLEEFIRLNGLTHVCTSSYHPQSNGKVERWHASIKLECIRPSCPETVEEARAKALSYVDHFNHERLPSGIGYVTPADRLHGLDAEIHAERDRKLEAARAKRQAA